MNTSESFIRAYGSDNATDVSSDTNGAVTYIIISVTTSIIIGAIMFGNTLVILSVHRFHALKNVNNYFICSLAFADLIVVVTAVYNAGLTLGTIPYHGSIYYCMLQVIAFQEGCQVSILHLLVIAIDRHLAITSSLTYPVKMTTRRAKWIIFVIWTLPVVYLALLVVYAHIDSDVDLRNIPCNILGIVHPIFTLAWFIIFFIIPFAIILVLYLHIFLIARKHSSRIAAQDHSLQCTTFKKNLKAAKTLGMVIGTFIICWVPFFGLPILIDVTMPIYGTRWLLYVLIFLANSNSALNPAIYAWRNREFRESFIKLLTMREIRMEVNGPISHTQIINLEQREV
ncbi:adenosine receptor A2b-like [Glandiceps talaboti]